MYFRYPNLCKKMHKSGINVALLFTGKNQPFRLKKYSLIHSNLQYCPL
mgnify:CR=1 FL=1